jgi:hypothetical protein
VVVEKHNTWVVTNDGTRLNCTGSFCVEFPDGTQPGSQQSLSWIGGALTSQSLSRVELDSALAS